MFSDPQFWVATAFVIFVLAIFNPIRKILNSSLDTKVNEIKSSIEEAEKLKNETQLILNGIKKRQGQVDLEINQIHSDAKEKIKILEIHAESKLKEQTSKRELLTTAKIDQIIRDANFEIQQNISHTAINAATILLKNKINQEEKQNLINLSIKELNTVLKN